MPSIAAHMVCAKLVAHNLSIDDPEFIKGNLLPDIIDNKESHKKIPGKYFYIPDIDYFIHTLDLSNNLYLGYLTHLLLDKYFLEDYVNNISFGKDLFSTKEIYHDYDYINDSLIKKFNLDVNTLKNILKNYNLPIDQKKYEKNISCLEIVDDSSKAKYLKCEDFSKFLVEVSRQISDDLRIIVMDKGNV